LPIQNELKKPSYNFATVVENATANAEKYFKENAKGWYCNGPK
jgi:hypothetical protein